MSSFYSLPSLCAVWEGNGYNVRFYLLQLNTFQHTTFSAAPGDWLASSPSTQLLLHQISAHAHSSLLACVPWCCSCYSWRKGPVPHRETTQTRGCFLPTPWTSLGRMDLGIRWRLSSDHGTGHLLTTQHRKNQLTDLSLSFLSVK